MEISLNPFGADARVCLESGIFNFISFFYEDVLHSFKNQIKS